MTIVDFRAPTKIANILLRYPASRFGTSPRRRYSHTIAAAAERWAGFAAAQKPSPLALQALGSGQPDQPFASDFPRYDHQD
ncbi:hypothetical protein [Bradyrhizobium sp. 1(2017)]|uniref:hypothetical protein n=1 Tax=Bradyrhizobium sp. 1(2017) TaxID=1404888 RepID=UPI00140F2FB1|nr:hypothetical protein [Bradyrhizobium sp. 1(2017)]QIO34096.1 hypothetical protein HAP40_21035 [Bradyrhizobium sp. 1(2017)]